MCTGGQYFNSIFSLKEIPKPNRHVFKAAFHLLGQKYPDSIYLHHPQSHQNRVTQFSILHTHTPQKERSNTLDFSGPDEYSKNAVL